MKIILNIALVVLLSGCAGIATVPSSGSVQEQSYVSVPMQPESLIDFSSERVNMAVDAVSAEDDLAEWINNDYPTRAEVSCAEADPKCQKMIGILSNFAVPYKHIVSDGHKDVALIYERVASHGCDSLSNKSQYIFGCAVSSNMLQMVGEQRQFVKPELVGRHDASRAVQQYNGLYGSNTEFME